MKRITIICLVLGLLFGSAVVTRGQDQAISKRSRLAVGFHLNNYHHDFGSGINLTTPYFFNNRVAVRFAVNLAYYEGISAGTKGYQWMPYTQYKLGLICTSGVINEIFRLYGEGGVLYISPNSLFSEKNVLGGYGHFGFEFFKGNGSPLCYFIELGSVGTGATAEKVEGKPFYANGFATSVGLRFCF